MGKVRLAIVVSRFNERVTQDLLKGARQALAERGITNVPTVWCPGAFELPQVAKTLSQTGRYEAIIALGAVVKGETYHFEVISDSVVDALQQVSLESGVPVALGVLTPFTGDQALERADPARGNKGAEAALAALEMATLMRTLDS